MRYLKALIPLILVLGLVTCAKPPQADIDAAKASVDTVAKNADVTAYAPNSLKAAQDSYAKLKAEVDAQAAKGALSRNYDLTKTLVTQTKAAADKAKADAQKAKDQAKADATALIAGIKAQFPDVDKQLATALKSTKKAVKTTATAMKPQVEQAKLTVAEAEQDLANGNYASAKAKAEAVAQAITDGKAALDAAAKSK
jgi:hypothetical protein